MEMTLAEFRDNAVKISLRGRLDTAGVDAVEKNFSVAAESRHALVDLSGVSFVASMGIRMFFSVARVLKATGYRLILVAPQALVREVFDNAGLSQIVPVVADEKQALELLPADPNRVVHPPGVSANESTVPAARALRPSAGKSALPPARPVTPPPSPALDIKRPERAPPEARAAKQSEAPSERRPETRASGPEAARDTR